ncbi:hypothetical protein HK405_010555 [Cladochytrium tenue]|nr:hypothetical protein HK405_010555 [Cladochytrium tenue]
MEVLNLDPRCWTASTLDMREIKLSYRKKSLLLHPDKCRHPRGPEAFEMLKSAETEITEDARRAWLVAVVAEARQIVFRRKRIVSLPSFERQPDEANELAALIRLETRRLLADQGNRDSIRIKNEVERRAAEQLQMAEEKKRKAEHDKQWEEVRPLRTCII